jgi:dimethylhistidine N-methyltransferase
MARAMEGASLARAEGRFVRVGEVGGDALEPFAREVRAGLSASPKRLRSKHFYDDVGSRYFAEIMDLPEYYLTRSEREILTNHAAEILDLIESGHGHEHRPLAVVDLGAGDGRKTMALLEKVQLSERAYRYHPIDASAGAMVDLAVQMPHEIPMQGLVGDYRDGLQWLQSFEKDHHRLVLFLGSNIGNFTAAEAEGFLHNLAWMLSPGDHVLVGFDLVKDPEILRPAYDDARGLTAAFNLNLLTRINRELGADFDLDSFVHVPAYNPTARAMESFLVSRIEQTVTIEACAESFDFSAWEAIHTERSQKYDRDGIGRLARETGFDPVAAFTDRKGYFMDALWRVRGASRVS